MALAVTAASMSSISASAVYRSGKLWLGVSSATAYINFTPTTYYWCGNCGDDYNVHYTSVEAFAYKSNGGYDYGFNSSYVWYLESCVLHNKARYSRCSSKNHGEAWNNSMQGYVYRDLTLNV